MGNVKDWPETFNPKDPELKKRINYNADDMNYIIIKSKNPLLACGATRKGKTCRLPAGFGTEHVGYGRCKFHGGCSTGPKTEEGKQNVGKTAIHGFYRSAMMPYEREMFDNMASQAEIGLEYEINFWKAKILLYLKRTAEKWQRAFEAKKNLGDLRAAEAADKETRVFYSVLSEDEDGGEMVSRKTHYYHAGTIEDKPLVRALETLSRLIDKHAKLKGLDKTDADNILEQINSELRGASYGQVSISWGGKPQTREENKG